MTLPQRSMRSRSRRKAMFGRRAGRAVALRAGVALIAVVTVACQAGAATPGPATAAPTTAAGPTATARTTPMAVQDVSLRLDWVPSWYHAPFYVALEKGYYRDAGLNVTILDGQGSNTTGQVVASGAETFGFMSLLSVPLLADKGAQLRAIGAFIQTAPEGVITLAENGINSPKDLEGKTWGYTP